MYPSELKLISINFPNLEELKLRTVVALPKDSNNGFAFNILSSKEDSFSTIFFLFEATYVKYCIIFFVFSLC